MWSSLSRLRIPRLFRPAPGAAARLTARTLAWAIALGLAGGAAGAAARLFFRGMQWIATGNASPSPPVAAAPLAPWHRAIVPLCGGLLAWGVQRLAKRVNPHAPPATDYTEAVQEGDGTIPMIPALWRTLSAACSIGTGATIGREGAMIQFAAAFASRTGQVLHSGDFPLTRQVACGVAAGVAVAYQAPLAAIFFAAEIVLLGTAWPELALLAISAYSGLSISRLVLTGGPLFAAPEHLRLLALHWWWAFPLAALLGGIGPAYQWLIRSMAFAKRWPVALIWSGAAVGLLSVLSASVWGNGDVALAHLVQTAPAHELPLSSAATIFLLRTVALVLCVGTGVIGGVFTPTLFTGATLGFVLAHTAPGHSASPDQVLLLVLIGMGSLIAAVTHAPLMSSFMAVEITGRWEAFPLLLVCNFLASTVAAWISPATLYGIATEQPAKHAPPQTR